MVVWENGQTFRTHFLWKNGSECLPPPRGEVAGVGAERYGAGWDKSEKRGLTEGGGSRIRDLLCSQCVAGRAVSYQLESVLPL